MLTSESQSFKVSTQLWRRMLYLVAAILFLNLWFIVSLLIMDLHCLSYLELSYSRNANSFNITHTWSKVDNPTNIFAIEPRLSRSLITTGSYTVNNFFSRIEVILPEENTKGKATINEPITSQINGTCDMQNGNLDFEIADFRCWITNTNPTSLPPSLFKIVPTDFSANSALLGNPSQHDNSPLGPNGSLTISHIYKATIPSQGNPQLHFDYLMYSHDVIYAVENKKFFDFLEVGIITSTMTPLEQFGNPNLDWDGHASVCRPTAWESNSGKVAHEVISLDKYRGQTIGIYFTLYHKTDGSCNSWAFIDNVKIKPELTLTKTSDPPSPIHEGDTITYTIAYTNTSLTTQTLTLTDILPFNVVLLLETVSPTAELTNSTLVWNLGPKPPGHSGQVSFRVQVPLFLSSQTSPNALSASLSTQPPTYVLPATVSCDTTRFWANGVTAQPSPSTPYTLQVQIPPGATPSKMWLLMKGINHVPPLVAGQPAQQIVTSTKSFSASLWSASITPTMTAGDQVTVITQNPRELNAIFLFDEDDPPFDSTQLDDFYRTPEPFTYTFDIPSVTTQTIDVLIPFMDINYLTDNLSPDNRLTTVTVQFNGQSHRITANDPNLGNGLLMTDFRFQIGHLDSNTVTKTLTVTVDTEDSLYTLGPRVCRPLYIENTALLCSQQAGCISATVQNVPDNYSLPHSIYLPVILKSSP